MGFVDITRVFIDMTAYQAILAEQANALTAMVSANLASPAGALTFGLKAALKGEEIALPIEDVVEVERRFRSIRVELKAKGDLEEFFARRVATMTVRVDRGVRLETATLSDQVRKAVTDFDAARINEATRLYDWIAADPLGHSRKLHLTIEGVDRMLQAFRGLKDDLTHPSQALWDWFKLEKIEHLMGRRLNDLPVSRAKTLSEAVGGEFKYLGASDGPGLDDFERRAWARDQLAALIDREIDRLEAHKASFDLEDLARERAGSVDRALFDASKEGSAARRYEAAAERSLYKALRELRQLQAEKARDLAEAAQTADSEPELGSFFAGERPAEPLQTNRPPNPVRDRSPERPRYPNGSRRPKKIRAT